MLARTLKTRVATIYLSALLFLLFSINACQPAGNTNANSNANAANANTNANANANAESGPAINTREPEKYSATLVFTIETQSGEKTIGIPPLSVQVARNGDDRRVEFNLPDATPLIYLDHQNHHYVISSTKKQYAELSQEATGVQVQKLMTPGQIVADLKDKRGVERVGDDQINGRAADKYRYATSKNTNTQAGQVSAEAFVYIDKDTGLPLRTELNAESSGNVKGVNYARVLAEMRDIKTTIDSSMFDIPSGYSQVPPETVRQQIDALTSAVAAIVKVMMANMQSAASPSASPSAAGSPR